MRSHRIYALRRAMLKALEDNHPVPCNMDEIASHPGLRMRHPTREELVSELQNLISRKFVEPVPGSNGDYNRISASGLDQINQECDLDPFIWGAMGF